MGFKFHFYFLPLVGGKITAPPKAHLQPLESGDMVPYPTKGEIILDYVSRSNRIMSVFIRERGKQENWHQSS